MSLILEALKKSERQRRLGESPSIGSPIMAVRQRRNWLPYLIILIVAGLAMLWWLKHDVDEPPAEPPAAASSAPAVVEQPAPKAVRRPAIAERARKLPAPASEEIAQSGTMDRLPPDEPATRDNANADPALKEKFESGELAAAADQRHGAPGQAPIVKESEAVPATARPAAPPAPGNTDAIAIAKLLDRVGAKGAADTADATAAKASTAPAAATEATPGDAVTLIWELPLATRRELPEIKLSMHVYAEDPAQRFVIVNGERHGEGDDVGSMKLIEIRKDGVVFEADKQRFLYPRGGR